MEYKSVENRREIWLDNLKLFECLLLMAYSVYAETMGCLYLSLSISFFQLHVQSLFFGWFFLCVCMCALHPLRGESLGTAYFKHFTSTVTLVHS